MVTLGVQHPSRRWIRVEVGDGLVAISPDDPTQILQLRSPSGSIIEIEPGKTLLGMVVDSGDNPINGSATCNAELFFSPDDSDTSYCLGYLISVREG